MNAPATTLGAAFTAAARAHAHRTALVQGGLSIGYGELAARAASAAGRLGALTAEEPVGICAHRSPGTVAAVLGTVLAGGAYVPLDPEAPEARLRGLVGDSGVRTVFAAPGDAGRLRAVLPPYVTVLPVEERPPGLGEPPPSAPGAPAGQGPRSLAYVMHTSGSTGAPKGVEVEHHSVLDLAHAPEAALGPGDTVLQLAPLHVDPSVFEIWGALLNGARLVLPEAVRPGVYDIGRECARHGVTVLRLAAPLFRLATEHITADLRGLRLFVSGGDRADAEAVRTALRELPGCRVVNGYGPTETTVYACWQVLDKPQAYEAEWRDDVPIGRPFAGATAHVLRPDRTVAAPGEEGELCVGGTGVARRYRGQGRLTAERFVPEPGRPDRAAYLTGDRVRLLPDGALAFLGRFDDQVKIRGHRVEPAEAERALLTHPAVGEAAVVPYGAPGSRRLAAFVVLTPDPEADERALLDHIAAMLPSPAVPATVTVLPVLPATANGKTDRRMLAVYASRGVGGGAVGSGTAGSGAARHGAAGSGSVDTGSGAGAGGGTGAGLGPGPEAGGARPEADERTAHARTAGSRTADPQTAGARKAEAESAEATTAALRPLAAHWQAVLGRPVGPDTDFFAVGGDSLAAMAVLARIERDEGVSLTVADLFRAPTVRAFADRVAAATAGVPAPAALPHEDTAWLRLTPGQEGIWFEQEAAESRERYVIGRGFLVRGPLHLPRLRAALTRLGRRQGALRTVVRRDADGWRQNLTADPGTALRHIDLTATPGSAPHHTDPTTGPAADQEARARELVAEQIAAGPDADGRTPLLRTLVLTLGPSRTLVHFAVHHAIADDWSLDVFLAELSVLYRDPETDGLPPLPLPYPDHLRHSLAPRPERLAAATDFWRSALAGEAAALDLVTDRPRPAVLSGAGDRVRLRIGRRQMARQAEAARRHGVSPYMFCLAGVYTVLAAHSERDALCLGTLAAGRDRAGTQDLVGCFVNLLPVRVEADAGTSVGALLAGIRAATAEALRHQDVPFQAVGRELAPATAARAAVPFQAVVNYRQRPPGALDLDGARATPWTARDRTTATFELAFSFHESDESDGGLDVEVEFSTDLYSRATAHRLAGQLVAVLDRLADGDPPLRDVELFEPGEYERLLRAPEPPPAGTETTLPALVARQAAARPHRTAVADAHSSLTYAELDRLTGTVAARLSARGIGPGDRVAVCLERSPLLVTALLGVLRTGAAYVPLDPAYPAERLRHCVEDSGAVALVCGKELSDTLARRVSDRPSAPPDGDVPPVPDSVPPAPDSVPPILDIDALTAPAIDALAAPAGEPGPRPGVPVDPGSAAYVIYTSGSTGRPRGVPVPHRAVVNTLLGCLDRHPFTEDDVWLQLTSPGFDVAAFEQFAPLVHGATLVYADDATRADGHALTRTLRTAGVTVMVTVPSLLRALDRPDLAGVRVLLVAGEPADVHDTRHFARDRVVVNGYGPTEAAILATTHRAEPRDRLARVPVGTPLPGTAAYVVDRHGRLAATGVPGELWLAGAGLGDGYWNDPEQTRRLFTTHPALGPAGRCYRTGDRVRRLPDGSIDYLGRLDHQVKIRGFRVELGEIEAALTEHPGVRRAVAVLLGAGAEGELAVGYVGHATPAEAREHLARLLPAHMVPRLAVPVDAVPTGSHGKADRKALGARLAAVRGLPPGGGTHSAANGTERRLLALWQEVLDGPVGSPEDDFFALGGHSLRVIRLLGRIEREYGVRIAVPDFLAAPTVRGVARRLDATGPAAVTAGPVVGPEDARLDPAVAFTVLPEPAAPHDTVLLTGGTGFVGAHVLAELLERTTGPVLCLVRAADPDAARRRLATALRRYGLRPDADDPRIVPVPGDLALPGLGLAGTRWEAAVREAAAVFHLGAQVHHLSGFQHLAAANVGGTAELLRIASEGRPARFHHISTLGVFTENVFTESVFADGRASARTITEATSTAHERHPRGRGYAAGKWAAEQLVVQALGRGADARIYRLGRAGGSTTGTISEDDFLSRLLITSALLGCHPDDPRLATDALPVDTMARALVALAGSGGRPGAVHHLHHPRRTPLAELVSVHDRRTGRTTPPVPLESWLHRLDEAEAAGRALPALAYREHLRDLLGGPAPGRPADHRDHRDHRDHHRNDATLAALHALGITPPALDDALVGRWWENLDRSIRHV
ncbi:amino acid adenylation domain-containing protein [Streptomyces sp. NPDC059452]|uniref:non-ribosomal peptide synthetase n=1 Tax=Streptomyces sp. NPDC059452 TaxID=3346835 RepID=UPI00369485BE